jgi:hypothetical protein
MHQNFQEINDTLSAYLDRGEPFSAIRIDNTAGYIMRSFFRGIQPSAEFFNNYSLIQGGIVPSDTEYYSHVIIPKTLNIMKQCDILGFVDVSGEIKKDFEFLSEFPNKPIFTDYFVLDPGGLLGYSPSGYLERPWTESLAGKKVLVVSSHANTIKEQWKNIDNIWGNNRKKIAPFELVDAISTPFHPALDDRQYENCNSFEDLVRITNDRIDQYDYDILLTGVTTQSPFYAQHAKERGKIGIQTGATIQLFFGILGGRWGHLNVPGYKPWQNMYNEYWKYPLDVDQPKWIDKIASSETAQAYWRKL